MPIMVEIQMLEYLSELNWIVLFSNNNKKRLYIDSANKMQREI